MAQEAVDIRASEQDLERVILLQGYGWDSHKSDSWYNIVRDRVPEIKDLGATHIWLPPPSQSVSPQGYLPGQLYNLQSAYGSKAQLQALIWALGEAGIVALADIVINHRCADEQDEHGVWNNYRDDVDHNNESIDWGQWAITGDDPEFGGTGAPDTGENYPAAPDLDHTNPGLQRGLIQWLNWLKDEIGFQGWRFDFAKGYAPRFVDLYTSKSVGHGVFSVAEYWGDLKWNKSDLERDQDEARQVLTSYAEDAGSVALFDFPTKGILAEAVRHTQYSRLKDKKGKLPGLVGWLPERAVTFVDNHDTGSTQREWPFPDGQEAVGYAYVLTHPGTPCILYEHVFEPEKYPGLPDTIKVLLDIRRRNDIRSTSSAEIQLAEDDQYVARIDDRLLLQLGPRGGLGDLTPKETEGWSIVANGKEFAVWERKTPE